jgi:LmbE family N-acetylglucosaminyl deacetylase
MLKVAGTAIVGTTLLGGEVLASESKNTMKPKKALVIGAHPDDPEGNVGGTMIRLRQAGWEVVSVYLTRGHGGIKGKSQEEAAIIRTQEAIDACKILDARPVFMSQIDGHTEVNKERYAEMQELIAQETPDVVFTHWPIDGHPDHRVCSILVYDAWRMTGRNFDLYYSEVMTGMQTQNFTPALWVDITSYRDKKIQAYLCHESQELEGAVKEYHDTMERMRGMECQAKYAEAFVQQLWK